MSGVYCRLLLLLLLAILNAKSPSAAHRARLGAAGLGGDGCPMVLWLVGLSPLSNQGRAGSPLLCQGVASSSTVSRSSEPGLLSLSVPGTPLQSLFSWLSAPSWPFLLLFLHFLMLLQFFVSGSGDSSTSLGIWLLPVCSPSWS